MADIYAANWDETDANNDDAAPDGFPEGMAPGGVNNGARAVMGGVKRYVNQNIPKTTGGTTTAYTLTYGVAPGALVDGMTHVVNFNATCGASPTLNVNSLGATPIHYFNGTTWAVVPSGMIKSGMTLTVAYNSSAGTYRIIGSAANVIVQSGITSTTGYQVFSGPTPVMMQWSTVQVAGAGGQSTVTFSPAFSNTPMTIQLTEQGSNTLPGVVDNMSSTQFRVTNNGSSTIFYGWVAWGAA